MADKAVRIVEIRREPIELYKLLKFEGLVSSGGEAKIMIDEGRVQVNGAVETRRRRKIMSGDRVRFAGEQLQIQLGPDFRI